MGEIVNYMQLDTSRMESVIGTIHVCWDGPLQVLVREEEQLVLGRDTYYLRHICRRSYLLLTIYLCEWSLFALIIIYFNNIQYLN